MIIQNKIHHVVNQKKVKTCLSKKEKTVFFYYYLFLYSLETSCCKPKQETSTTSTGASKSSEGCCAGGKDADSESARKVIREKYSKASGLNVDKDAVAKLSENFVS